MARAATDYVYETKSKVKTLIEGEFNGAAVYLADLDNIPTFGPGGTFCVEGLTSGVAVNVEPATVIVTVRVWTYVEELDPQAAEKRVSGLAQRLEALLWNVTRPGPGRGCDWLRTEYLETTYLLREKGRVFRRQYLRAARTDWRVRLAAAR